MAPEQAAGRAVDARADLFSMGCVLYELATGQRAFVGRDPLAVLSLLATYDPPPPRKVRASIPTALSTLIARLLAKSPEGRPQSAAEVVAALTQIGEHADDSTVTIDLPPDEAASAASQPERSSRARLWVGLVALTLIALLTAARGIKWGDPSNSPAAGNAGQSPPLSVASVAAPVRVLSIDVEHFARLNEHEAEPRGTLGRSSFAPRLGDQVTIEARLSRPAYAYLLAFRPDGEIELCFPEDEWTPPRLTDRPRYPSEASPAGVRYGLAEGAGLWVFAAVASERPLPAYRDFAAGRETAWSAQTARLGTVWWYDGQWVEPLTGRAGGESRAKGERALGASAAVVGAANWLKRASSGETVAAIGFAVAEK